VSSTETGPAESERDSTAGSSRPYQSSWRLRNAKLGVSSDRNQHRAALASAVPLSTPSKPLANDGDGESCDHEDGGKRIDGGREAAAHH
jgi:hypothetical protein